MGIVHIRNNSVNVEIPLASVTVTGSGAVQATDGDGLPAISLPTAATAYVMHIPLSGFIPWAINLVNPGSSVADPYGFQFQALYLWYLVSSTNPSVNTVKLLQEAPVNGAARAAATGFNGNVASSLAVTNNGTAGTAAAPATGVTLVTTASANVNLSIITPNNPIWWSADSTFLTATWAITTGATTGTAKVCRIMMKGAFGLEG